MVASFLPIRLSPDLDDVPRRPDAIAINSPLVLAPLDVLHAQAGRTIPYLESPDALLDENFEEAFKDAMNGDADGNLGTERDCTDDEELDEPESDDFSDVAKYEIVEVVGDDSYGRKVITIYACRLPSNKDLNHNRLLK